MSKSISSVLGVKEKIEKTDLDFDSGMVWSGWLVGRFYVLRFNLFFFHKFGPTEASQDAVGLLSSSKVEDFYYRL